MIPLTNSKLMTVAAILPTENAKTTVSAMLEGEERERVLKLLNSGECAVTYLPEEVECDGITSVKIPIRITENTVAHHIIGCVDADGNGTSGIEYAYNKILSAKEPLCASFPVNGKGEYLMGTEPEIGTDDAYPDGAVVTTIDINIQKTVEECSAGLLSGAVVVCESKTGKIRAMLSLPDYSPSDISASLENPNSPLFNRCLASFNVGSVFKPCIAAAGIENGKKDMTLFCGGSAVIEDRKFNCHKHDGHGQVDIYGAIANSCNCFFYALSGELGEKTVYSYAKRFSFGSKIKIADGIYADAGNIAKQNELLTLSAKANFGIGQGATVLSPIALLNLYNAVASGGEYYMPSVVEKTMVGNKSYKYDVGAPTRAITKETAEILKQCLCGVISYGTGTAAKSEKIAVAGKTATAQTGRADQNGKEITNSWFCGFFPVEEPVFTVVVMADGEFVDSPATVFKRISEKLS